MNLLTLASDTGPELMTQRGVRSKTFNQGGLDRRAIHTLHPLHVPRNMTNWRRGGRELFDDVDISAIDEGSFYRVGHAWYSIVIPKSSIGFQYASKTKGNVSLTLSEINRVALRSANASIAPQFLGNRVIWNDVRPGLDMELILRPGRVEMIKRIRATTAPHEWAWEVIEDIQDLNFQRVTQGFDNENRDVSRMTEKRANRQRPLEINHEWAADDFSTNPGKNTRRFRETITGRAIKRDPITRVPGYVNERVYPLFVDATITENITANADDGYENNLGGWNVSGDGSNLSWPGHYGGGNTSIGVRFQTINLTGTETINAGTQLQIRVDQGYNSTPDIGIWADDIDSASVFGSGDLPSAITKTTAETQWDPITTGRPSTDNVSVKAHIEELIARAGWSTNNSIRFGILGTYNGASNQVAVRDYSHASFANDVQLVIDYTASGGGGGRIMSSLARTGGLVGMGGLAGQGGGLAG